MLSTDGGGAIYRARKDQTVGVNSRLCLHCSTVMQSTIYRQMLP